MLRRLSSVVAAALLLCSCTAGASEALDLFRKSETAYNELRFLDAAELLQKAYALSQDPVLLYNLARAYEGAGSDVQALDAYLRYLQQLPAAPDASSVNKRVAALRTRIADRAALAEQRDEERRRADANQLAAARAVAEARAVSPAPWVVAGAGGLALGGGVGLGLAANGKRASAEAAPSAGLAQSELGTARAFATGANVAYGVGAAVAAAGIVWGVWNLVRRPPATGLTVVVGPGSIGAGVTF